MNELEDRKTVSVDWNYLKNNAGINLLTSESCGVGMRLLCDVDEEGEIFLNAVFAGTQLLHSGWNNSKHKSVMLFKELLKPLVIFHLLFLGYEAVVSSDNSNHVVALRDASSYDYRHGVGVRIYRRYGTAGLRNRHEMSGRVT